MNGNQIGSRPGRMNGNQAGSRPGRMETKLVQNLAEWKPNWFQPGRMET